MRDEEAVLGTKRRRRQTKYANAVVSELTLGTIKRKTTHSSGDVAPETCAIWKSREVPAQRLLQPVGTMGSYGALGKWDSKSCRTPWVSRPALF